jgi:hypothetical protein
MCLLLEGLEVHMCPEMLNAGMDRSVVTSYDQYIEDILRRLEVVNEELQDNNMMWQKLVRI